jgi:hypothetical protein
MIERLRQAQGSADPVLSRAAQLLQSLDPSEDSASARRRVWAALNDQPRHVSRGFWLARPVLAAGLTVCLTAAVAGASVGRGFFAQVKSVFETASEPPVTHSLPAAKPRAHTPPKLTPRVQSAEAQVTPPAQPTPTASLAEPGPPANRPARPASRPPAAKRSSVGAEAFAAAPREEASLVLGAMTALRRDHDPARSASLLSIYLYKYPKGVLREEALALQIEAASSLRDPNLGARYARGYLQSHPNGRFSDLAKNALERSATSETKP